MSQKPVGRSPDLKRLRDEGYSISVVDGHLVVQDIPYVNAKREIKRGTFVSELTLADDTTRAPSTHVMMFAGEFPCDKDGNPLTAIGAPGQRQKLSENLAIDHTFSSKPASGAYPDYYDKVRTYALILESQAQALDPLITARLYAPVVADTEDPIFKYIDTATSRAGIGAANRKLMMNSVAIVGVGGTGSYVLDLVAKAPVRHIHLFDGDLFLQHNAFRCPGAASLEELRGGPTKVAYLERIYARMRNGIVGHPHPVREEDLPLLATMDFVFICMDSGPLKKRLIDALEAAGKPFIDVGMGIELVGDLLTGMLRVTVSTAGHRDHVRNRISFAENLADNEYGKNIQIADLNAFNAALAVMMWKASCGFYFRALNIFNATFAIGGNEILNDNDKAA